MSSSPDAAVRRLILVPAQPRAERGDAMIRRYRIARLRLEGPDGPRAERFARSRRGPG